MDVMPSGRRREHAQYVTSLKIYFRPRLRAVASWILKSLVILRGRAGYELIYITNEAVGRVGYYQLISCKSEKNNCFSKFSSSPITGNCHSAHLFPLHKTYSENITWPVINARSSWRAKTYWMNWQRAERIVRSKSVLRWMVPVFRTREVWWRPRTSRARFVREI